MKPYKRARAYYTKHLGDFLPWYVKRWLLNPYVILPVPKPVVRSRSLVVLVRLPPDEEYVLLGMARDRHNAMVGNLLKIIKLIIEVRN